MVTFALHGNRQARSRAKVKKFDNALDQAQTVDYVVSTFVAAAESSERLILTLCAAIMRFPNR